MNIEEVRTSCLSLPGVTEDMPYGPDWVVFRIERKIFLHISLERRLIAIKLLPECGEELRDKYDAVTPAWHMNKKHWNDIIIENTFPNETIEGWISRQCYEHYAKFDFDEQQELSSVFQTTKDPHRIIKEIERTC